MPFLQTRSPRRRMSRLLTRAFDTLVVTLIFAVFG